MCCSCNYNSYFLVRLTGSEQVQVRMRSKDPEAVMLAAERLDSRSFLQVPNTDGLVLSTRNNQLPTRVEQRRRDIVEVSTARIHLPRLSLAHAPNLDSPIIGGRDDEW